MDDEEWLAGVQLWYNDHDYLGAIQVWQESLDSLDWGDDCHDTKNVECKDESTSPFALILEHPVPYGIDVARRLLFLAGCQLDMPNVTLARLSLRRCLQCLQQAQLDKQTLGNDDDNDDVIWDSPLARRALQEWICSYDDETHVSTTRDDTAPDDDDQPLDMAGRIVEFAIQRGCKYWKFPLQRAGFLDSTILQDSKPYYEPDEHPSWCRLLEEHWETIRDEFLYLARQHQERDGNRSSFRESEECQYWPAVGTSDHRGGSGQHDHKVVDGDWREVVLFGAGAQPKLAPFTSNLIRKHILEATTLADQGGGEVIFSVLGSNTRIRPHCGTTNLRLTAHLGLSIPSASSKECGIRVGNKWHCWENGRVMVFDDSFEHEVRNITPHYRAVLLLRFWNPHLKEDKVRASALAEAVDSKEADAIRRYNPPLPSSLPATIEARGLELNRCPGCWRNGHSTIRVVNLHDSSFACSCGHPISR
jgi:hypothetical protein